MYYHCTYAILKEHRNMEKFLLNPFHWCLIIHLTISFMLRQWRGIGELQRESLISYIYIYLFFFFLLCPGFFREGYFSRIECKLYLLLYHLYRQYAYEILIEKAGCFEQCKFIERSGFYVRSSFGRFFFPNSICI